MPAEVRKSWLLYCDIMLETVWHRKMATVFRSKFFNFELLRALHAAPFQAADIGECLEAAATVKDGNVESWYQGWQVAAEKTLALAKEAALNNDKEAERWCLLRSWNYLRASESLLHTDCLDPRLLSVSEKAVTVYRKGMRLLDSDVICLEIPYEDYHLPAYLYMPTTTSKAPGKIPVIINTPGFDSSQEELYLFVAAGARTRGYAVLSFEGPGQGLVLRKLKKHMRPDWEVVTSTVIDFLEEYSSKHASLDLDMSRLALAGNSLGGYFVLRGAADPRVKACLSVDGFYDLWLLTESRLPKWLTGGWRSGWLGDWLVNGMIRFASWLDVQAAWEFSRCMWVFGVATPADVLREFQRYSLREADGGTYLRKVRCPVLVTGAADTLYFSPELSTDLIYANLKHLDERDKSLWISRGLGQGGQQAKIGAMSVAHQKMFAWLNEKLDHTQS